MRPSAPALRQARLRSASRHFLAEAGLPHEIAYPHGYVECTLSEGLVPLSVPARSVELTDALGQAVRTADCFLLGRDPSGIFVFALDCSNGDRVVSVVLDEAPAGFADDFPVTVVNHSLAQLAVCLLAMREFDKERRKTAPGAEPDDPVYRPLLRRLRTTITRCDPRIMRSDTVWSVGLEELEAGIV